MLQQQLLQLFWLVPAPDISPGKKRLQLAAASQDSNHLQEKGLLALHFCMSQHVVAWCARHKDAGAATVGSSVGKHADVHLAAGPGLRCHVSTCRLQCCCMLLAGKHLLSLLSNAADVRPCNLRQAMTTKLLKPAVRVC
jgi:hypothetical protein